MVWIESLAMESEVLIDKLGKIMSDLRCDVAMCGEIDDTGSGGFGMRTRAG